MSGTYNWEYRDSGGLVIGGGSTPAFTGSINSSFSYSLTSSLDPSALSALVMCSGAHTTSGSGHSDCLGHSGSFSADSRSGGFGGLEEVWIEIEMVDPQPCCGDGGSGARPASPAPSAEFYWDGFLLE